MLTILFGQAAVIKEGISHKIDLLFLELAEYFIRIPELFPVENKRWNTVFFSPFQNVSIRDITKDRFYAELRFLSKILNDIFSVRT